MGRQKRVRALIDELEKAKIVEKSQSNWLNPVVLTRKKNGKLRFCVDFRRLNKMVPPDHYELPRIQDMINSLHGKKYFTTIDLKDGFFQIPIADADKHETTFAVNGRLMQFRRCQWDSRIVPLFSIGQWKWY